jgi:hypothetical protein
MKMVSGDKNKSGNVQQISMSYILNVIKTHGLEWLGHVL